jgi:hypothetical protein
VAHELSAARRLANLLPGESARVDSFSFDTVRALCGDLGIREGDALHCRAGTGGMLVLVTQDGSIVTLARDWARFITVQPTEPLLAG